MEQQSMNSETRSFTYSEIVKITSNFKKVIGKGGFGEVYFGTLNDGSDVAVKISSSSSKQDPKAVLQEAKLLAFIHHQNLVSLVGYCDENGNEALIYDYVPNGNLKQHLSEKSEKILGWNERLQIALDVAHGLNYLHGCKPPIVHRDLKPENILLTEHKQAKIADFGLSRAFTTESVSHISTRPAGTCGYLDPESYQTGRISKKSDVYSFGIILLELITGQPAVITRDKEDIIHITNWIDPLFRRRDIQSIVDPRLNGEFNTNVARKAIEIAVSCVGPITKRPDTSHVVAKLEKCLDMGLHSRLASENGWLTNILDRVYKNSTKRQKGATMKSMKELPIKSMEELPMKSMEELSMEELPMNSRNRIFTYIQIAEITSNFKTVIEKGEFVIVYRGILNDDTLVAVEVLSQSPTQGYEEFQDQVESLSLLQHENVVSLVGCCDENDNKAVIYNYMPNGNLKQQLSEKSKTILSWNERLQIAVDIANGLEYLQTCGQSIVVQGNLQTTDILLDTNMQAKIHRIRLATHYDIRNPAGFDPMYFYPGVFDRSGIYDDHNGFGLILLELITGGSEMIPGEGYGSNIIQKVRTAIEKREIQSIVDPRLKGKFNDYTFTEVAQLAMSCLWRTASPRSPPSIRDVIEKLNRIKRELRTEIVHQEKKKRINKGRFGTTESVVDNG